MCVHAEVLAFCERRPAKVVGIVHVIVDRVKSIEIRTRVTTDRTSPGGGGHLGGVVYKVVFVRYITAGSLKDVKESEPVARFVDHGLAGGKVDILDGVVAHED